MSVQGLKAFSKLLPVLKEKFSSKALIGKSEAFGELTLTISHAYLIEFLTFIRDDSRFLFVSLVDICGVDYPFRPKRFEVCYHLLSPYHNLRLRVKVETALNCPVPSVTTVYVGANWYEREAYDLYGIIFSGHPDLRRLLTDYGFEGHPLRKDFPTTGFVECRYDQEVGRVVYEPVVLAQEMRNFDSLSPWDGMNNPVRDKEKI